MWLSNGTSFISAIHLHDSLRPNREKVDRYSALFLHSKYHIIGERKFYRENIVTDIYPVWVLAHIIVWRRYLELKYSNIRKQFITLIYKRTYMYIYFVSGTFSFIFTWIFKAEFERICVVSTICIISYVYVSVIRDNNMILCDAASLHTVAPVQQTPDHSLNSM